MLRIVLVVLRLAIAGIFAAGAVVLAVDGKDAFVLCVFAAIYFGTIAIVEERVGVAGRGGPK